MYIVSVTAIYPDLLLLLLLLWERYKRNVLLQEVWKEQNSYDFINSQIILVMEGSQEEIFSYVSTLRQYAQYFGSPFKQPLYETRGPLLRLFYILPFLNSQDWPRNWCRKLRNRDIQTGNVLILQIPLKLLVIVKKTLNHYKKQASASLSPNFLDRAYFFTLYIFFYMKKKILH